MRKILKNKKGFTLLELIIYVFIVAIILTAITMYAIDVIGAQTKAKSYQEVQYNARFAIRRIVNEIRRADDLNDGSSTFDTHPGVLSIGNNNPTKDPTVFDIASNRLRMTQGGTPYFLTSDKVEITNMVFKDLSVANRTNNIKISMTVAHRNPENREEFDAEFTISSTAVIREQED